MNSCCCCRRFDKSTAGHVFDCQHFLCEQCLESFDGSTLRAVCFTCGSPAVDIAPQSPSFDSSKNNCGQKRTMNASSIIDDYSGKKSSVPAELVFDRNDLVITDEFLSPRSEGSCRMEEKALRSPRKKAPSPGGSGSTRQPFSSFAQTLREKKRELEAAEKSFVEQGNVARTEIEKHAQMCRALIERDEKRLLQQLDKTISEIRSENSEAISKIWSLIQRLENAGDDGVDRDEVEEQLLTTRINTTQFKDIKVGVNDGFYPPDDRNIVGQLKIESIADHSSFLLSPVLIGSLTDVLQRPVTGLTTLDREIFVAYDNLSEVSVYSVMTHTHLRTLSLLKLLEPILTPCPIDLAACPTTRSVYVADSRNNHTYHLKPDGKLVYWWAVDKPIRGLSVTTTGTVLVGSGKAVKEYDPTGKLLRTISTSPLGSLFRGKERPSMKRPTHFLETDRGRIIVCDFIESGIPHVVYDVDRKGSAVSRWHGNRADSGAEFLDEPRHLAIDVTGHVMVADRRNDRVKLLDAELKFVRDLLGPGSGFKRPQRLHYDPARGLLYVGLVAGITLVYRVTL